MKQEIRCELPPNFKEVVKVFPQAAERGVIFAWGNIIYNPSCGQIPPQLMAHEAVHGARQQALADHLGVSLDEGVIEWWRVYMEVPEFRFEEELPAHQEEYKVYCTLVKDREQRNRYLHRLACRLAGDLYGRCVPYFEAKRKISGKLQS